jgi:hypothetical protein
MPKKEEVHMVWRKYKLDYNTRQYLEGKTPKQIIEMMSNLPVPEDAVLNISSYDDYGSSSTDVYFEWREPESEEEKAQRLKNEAWARAIERRQYMELKKKFEGS